MTAETAELHNPVIIMGAVWGVAVLAALFAVLNNPQHARALATLRWGLAAGAAVGLAGTSLLLVQVSVWPMHFWVVLAATAAAGAVAGAVRCWMWGRRHAAGMAAWDDYVRSHPDGEGGEKK